MTGISPLMQSILTISNELWIRSHTPIESSVSALHSLSSAVTAGLSVNRKQFSFSRHENQFLKPTSDHEKSFFCSLKFGLSSVARLSKNFVARYSASPAQQEVFVTFSHACQLFISAQMSQQWVQNDLENDREMSHLILQHCFKFLFHRSCGKLWVCYPFLGGNIHFQW